MNSAGPEDLRSGLRALVMDDSVVIALDIKQTLIDAGVTDVVTASTVEKGLDAVAGTAIDIAIIDYDMAGGGAMTVADALASLRIPFVIVTGYGTDVEIPSPHQEAPLLSKPFSNAQLAALTRKLLSPP